MTTQDDTYNGWTNKPTWLVKLWIDNDQGEQEYWLQQARDFESGLFGTDRPAAYALADTLKEYFEEQADTFMRNESTLRQQRLISDAGFFADLMSWAVAMVNWDEVAKALIEDAAEVV
jgi:hypothetical protein